MDDMIGEIKSYRKSNRGIWIFDLERLSSAQPLAVAVYIEDNGMRIGFCNEKRSFGYRLAKNGTMTKADVYSYISAFTRTGADRLDTESERLNDERKELEEEVKKLNFLNAFREPKNELTLRERLSIEVSYWWNMLFHDPDRLKKVDGRLAEICDEKIIALTSAGFAYRGAEPEEAIILADWLQLNQNTILTIPEIGKDLFSLAIDALDYYEK